MLHVRMIGFLICQLIIAVVEAQIAIEGPTCVTTGLIYQYNLTGAWESTFQAKVAVEGGYLADSRSNGVQKVNLSRIRINWENATEGSITLKTKNRETTLKVKICPPLHGGFTKTTAQFVTLNGIPDTISCSGGFGGHCDPEYAYQWEKSDDALNWQTVPGATKDFLLYSYGLNQTTFFRRKTVEAKTGEVAYSNSTAVYIQYPNL